MLLSPFHMRQNAGTNREGKWSVQGSKCKVKFSMKEYLKSHAFLLQSPLNDVSGAEHMGPMLRATEGADGKHNMTNMSYLRHRSRKRITSESRGKMDLGQRVSLKRRELVRSSSFALSMQNYSCKMQ